MHNHAPCGGAALTGSADCAEEDRLRCHVEIGARRNDERVVAAEFHDRFAQATVHCSRDVQTHGYRASGRDQRNPGIVG